MPSDDEKSVVGSDAADENSDSDRGSGEEVYEVEKILKRRVVRNKNEYLVRWRGYTPSADTWEPEANLGGAKEAMKKFLESEDGKGGGSAKGKKRSSGGGGIGSSSSASKSKKNTTTGAGSSKRMFDDEAAAAADDSSGAEEGSDDDDFQPAKKLKKESDPAMRGRPAAGNKKKKAGGGKGAARKASPSGGSRSTVTPVPKPNFDSPLAKALKTRTQLGINQRKLDWLNSDDSDNSKRDDSVDKVPPKEQKDNQEKMNGDLVQKVNAVKENSVGTVAGSPPPPVDPVGNNSRKDEDLFSDHDEVDSASNKMAHMPGSGEKGNGLVKSDDNLSTAETARMNGTSSSASFRASTSTPVANNSGGSRKNEKASNSNSKAKVKTVEEQEDDEAEEKEEEEEEQGPRSTRRQPRHVAQTNNKKSCPQKLHINAMFRDGKGQLMLMANQGTSVGVTTTINGALERKLVLLLKEELKNGLDD